MPGTTIYLPTNLHREVRRSGINMSRVCQEALREALGTPKEVAELDTVEELTEALKDLGWRLNSELKRMAVAIERNWEPAG